MKSKYFKKYTSLIAYTLSKYNEEVSKENNDGTGLYFAILNIQMSDLIKVFLIKDFNKIESTDEISKLYNYHYNFGGQIDYIDIYNNKGKLIYTIKE